MLAAMLSILALLMAAQAAPADSYTDGRGTLWVRPDGPHCIVAAKNQRDMAQFVATESGNGVMFLRVAPVDMEVGTTYPATLTLNGATLDVEAIGTTTDLSDGMRVHGFRVVFSRDDMRAMAALPQTLISFNVPGKSFMAVREWKPTEPALASWGDCVRGLSWFTPGEAG